VAGGETILAHTAFVLDKYQLSRWKMFKDEYQRVGKRLAAKFSGISIEPMLALAATHAVVVPARALSRPVCDDPDDDKFLACVLAGRCRVVVSGDKGLLRVSGYRRIQVLTARQFVDTHLKRR
jgi:predicted nucleic acid-binding protein